MILGLESIGGRGVEHFGMSERGLKMFMLPMEGYGCFLESPIHLYGT